MKNLVTKSLCCSLIAMGISVANAQVVVRIGPPPPPVHEVPPPAPHPGWVWQPGHHFYENGRYVWHAGFYAAPPHPHAHWVPGHWAHRRDGYVWIDGHWA
jgi:hypothetical protein